MRLKRKSNRFDETEKTWYQKLGGWVIQIGVVIFLAFLIVQLGIQKVEMVGDSMSATLEDGDTLVVNKLRYIFTNPERFDIIIFKNEESNSDYYNIKRVVGLPGETIQIKEGQVYINKEPLDEVIPVEQMVSAGIATEEITLGENEFFVLGDNRNSSQDSRFVSVGTVQKSEIVGKVWVRANPYCFVDSLNTLEKQEQTE